MRVSALALITIVAGCGGDTQSAADTAAAAQSEEAEPAPPPAPATKIGQLPLLAAVLPGGKCAVTPFGSFSVIKREIVYEIDYPARVIKVAVGDSARAFAPISFDVMMRRDIGIGQDETETIQAFFDATGNISSGNRQYVSTGSNAASERQGLLQSDPNEVRQIALQIMDYCRNAKAAGDTTSN